MRCGKLHRGRSLRIKTRAELLRSIHPRYWQYLRPDTGDVPVAAEESSQAVEHPAAPRMIQLVL
jgi:hypothetical protein